MKVIKTPQERFNTLPEYPFSPNYLEVEEGLNMHYLDEGDVKAPIVLLLHGEPSWSYLYRKMISVLVNNGFRAIAPDLIGFGKSDKITEKSAYSYATHLNWLRTFIEKLDLTEITLFCQDWGGLLGLRLITELEDRFSLVVASNTGLPTGNIPMPESFQKWKEFSQNSPKFDIGRVIQAGTLQELSDEVVAAYNAPFPSEEYKAGARMFPTLVPASPDDPESNNNRLAWKKLMQWKKPFLTIFGDGDDIMRGADKALQKFIPGTKGQKHTMLHAGHFIQEEKGEELATLITQFYKDNT
jgi:haloalkane dehalogenase